MLELLQMWAMVEVLGFLFLPLTATVFHNLPDRGWAFSKAIGLAVLAFCVWLPLMVFQALSFSQPFIFGVLLLLAALNIAGFVRVRKPLLELVRSNFFYILCAELVFFGMTFLLGWLRSYGPDIHNFEMFMDEGFLSSIMRSSHFPPNDMWYSGQPINYYYYAHYTIAMLAKLLGQTPSIAFNTGICMFFGLTAINLFGVTSNVVAWAQHRRRRLSTLPGSAANGMRPDSVLPTLHGALPYGLLTMLLGLVLGNLAATQTWWVNHGDLPAFAWFNASRVVPNTINEFPAFSFLLSCFHAHVLALAFTIVGIAFAFNLLLEANGQGLGAFGRGWRLPLTIGVTALLLGSLYAMNGWDYPTYLALALICLVFQQWLAHHSRLSWDFALDVFTACASLAALSFFLFAPFYMHFVSPAQGLGLVQPADRTPPVDVILIYGVFAFIFLSFLVTSFFRVRTASLPAFATGFPRAQAESSERPDPQRTGPRDVPPFLHGVNADASTVQMVQEKTGAAPVTVSTLREVEASAKEEQGEEAHPAFVAEQEQREEVGTPGPWIAVPSLSIDGLTLLDPRFLGLVGTLLVAILLLFVVKNGVTFVVAGGLAALGAILALYHVKERERSFVLFLGATACALIAFCEIIFLRDVFVNQVPRMNTVFKFYFQAWALLSVVGGAGAYFVLDNLRATIALPTFLRVRFSSTWLNGYAASRVLWSAALLVLLLMGAVYPLTAPKQRTSNFMTRSNSLDGLDYMRTYDPADYTAIRWINGHITGAPVLAEAPGPDYSDYGRISIFTGLPSIMNWPGHELQWRINWFNGNNGANGADFSRRVNDLNCIYVDPAPQHVLTLLASYQVRYVYVGPLEQATYLGATACQYHSQGSITYQGANLQRFQTFLKIVYRAQGVTIYQVP